MACVGSNYDDMNGAGPSTPAKDGFSSRQLRGTSLSYMGNKSNDVQSRPVPDPNFELDFWQCLAVSDFHFSILETKTDVCIVYLCKS